MDKYYYYYYDEDTNTTDLIPTEAPSENADSFGGNVRMVWHAKQEKWYFSIVDVVQALTDSVDGRKYWNKLKQRLSEEGNETVTKCHQLKMKAADGKMRLTDAADQEQLLRLIQSIPSPKAEPFKVWLAQVGSERLDETADPEIAINRAMELYQKKGYTDKWIIQRLRTIEIRKELTNEWERSGIKESKEFAALTDILTRSWSGMSTQQYKQFKGLKKENLRDNMTNTELALNLLAEVSTTEISRNEAPRGFNESKKVAKRGGGIAGRARKDLEKELGRRVISPANADDKKSLSEE